MIATEQTKKHITVIQPKKEYDRTIKAKEKKLRVAAYCRVSTLQEQQESSFEAQVRYYTALIENHENWTMAGIYADDGISGTNMKKREEFNRLIQDCEAGKIDMVITKSISRFARNTVDTLNTIRTLKMKNIAVFFEKENINTLESAGELLITILSSQAQEESRNLSENTRWGIIRRFESGKVTVNHKKFMGYTKNAEGELVIVPEEAKIVRLIYRLYLEGKSLKQMKEQLEREGVKTVTGKDNWSEAVLTKMLTNEKYMGDALLQKTYTVDFLSKKRVVNDGIVKQYYIHDNHEAIISKEVFYAVQREREERASKHKATIGRRRKTEVQRYSSRFMLANITVCGECGQPYRRVVWNRKYETKAMWRCYNRVKYGTKYCKHSPSIREEHLQQAVMRAINKVQKESTEFNSVLRNNIAIILESYPVTLQSDNSEIDKKIEDLEKEVLELIKSESADIYNEGFLEKYKALGKQLQDLKKEKAFGSQKYENERIEVMEKVDKKLNQISKNEMKFDPVLVKWIVKSIRVINENRIEIEFKTGLIVSESLDVETYYI